MWVVVFVVLVVQYGHGPDICLGLATTSQTPAVYLDTALLSVVEYIALSMESISRDNLYFPRCMGTARTRRDRGTVCRDQHCSRDGGGIRLYGIFTISWDPCTLTLNTCSPSPTLLPSVC